MAKTTFTAAQLQGVFNDVLTADERYPEYPLKNNFSYNGLCDEGAFPLTFRQIGEDKNVTVYVEDYFGGEEGGDHAMYIIYKVGYGENARYFEKTGEYNSWDDSSWDGPITEVVSQKVERVEWVAK